MPGTEAELLAARIYDSQGSTAMALRACMRMGLATRRGGVYRRTTAGDRFVGGT